MNLFATAPETKKSKSTTANREQVVINESSFHKAVYRLAQIDAEKDALKAEETSLNDDVKLRSIEEFSKLYDKTGVYPGSFDIVATGAKNLKDATFMCLPTDKYISLNEDSFNFLKETYGKEIVEKTETYTMNTELVEKYGEVISKLILNCKEISDQDKLMLISKSTSYSVRKGTIKSLKTFKTSVSELVANILPVFQRKNIRIIE